LTSDSFIIYFWFIHNSASEDDDLEALNINGEVAMPFKVTLESAMKGIKFATKEEAIDAMWEFYKDKMTREEFEKFIQAQIEEV
jgi:hypothetical protein